MPLFSWLYFFISSKNLHWWTHTTDSLRLWRPRHIPVTFLPPQPPPHPHFTYPPTTRANHHRGKIYSRSAFNLPHHPLPEIPRPTNPYFNSCFYPCSWLPWNLPPWPDPQLSPNSSTSPLSWNFHQYVRTWTWATVLSDFSELNPKCNNLAWNLDS